MEIRKLSLILFFSVLSIFHNNSFGAEELSFEQAYQLMLTNNNSLKAAAKSVEQYKYKRSAARGYFLPSIGINSTYAHLNDDIDFSLLNGMVSVPIQNKNLWFVGAGLNWNVFTGGKILALNSAANAGYDGANEKYKQKQNELTVELVKRYYGLRLAQDVVRVRQQVFDTVQSHLNDAIKLEKQGVIAKTERLHAEVALSEAERELKASIRDKNVIEKGLYSLLQNDEATEFSPSSNLFVYNKEFPSQEDFFNRTMTNNSSLKLLDVKKKLAKAKYRSELGNYSPTISLFAYDILASADLTSLAPRWAMGASVNFKVFDGLTRLNNVKAAKAYKEETEFEISDAKEGIELLVNKFYQELLKYKEQYESTDKSLESAEEALRVSLISFKEGFSTSLSVTDAQSALAGVKIARLSSIYNYDVTLAELLSLEGNSGEIFDYINNSKQEKL